MVFTSYGKAAVLQRPGTNSAGGPTAQPSAAVQFVSGNAPGGTSVPVYGAATTTARPPRDPNYDFSDPANWLKSNDPAAPTPPPGYVVQRNAQTGAWIFVKLPTGPLGSNHDGGSLPSGTLPPSTTPVPKPTPTPTPKPVPTGPGAGTGVGPSNPAPGSTTNYGGNPYLSALVGTPNGSFANQYTENQQNSVLTNPDLLGRGVMRQMGQDPSGGYGSIISDDAKAVTPLVAYLMSQGGQGDPATTLNTVGQLLQNRATAGGKGGIDESVFAQILNPQSQTARAMLGLGNGGDIADLAPEQQMQMVNQYYGAGIDLGLNPYIGQAVANQLNSAGTNYQERIAMGGAGATDPYYQYLQKQGFANMFPR